MIRDAVMENENIGANSRDIQKLKEMFPQCFDVAGNFSMETFKGILKKEINIRDEGYELNFLGKNYARMLASLETTTVIQPDEEHNNKPENKDSKNIYISGDNLDALKHMLKSYEGAVKCIYIDPPYNTGSDGFIYKDKFTFTVESLMEKLNISESEAERLMSMTSRGSASHSAWLTFMYPRLLLARDLLSKDGVIFISIDDNEQANLKLLCDSVFGEENFKGNISVLSNPRGRDYGGIAKCHEYLLVYSKGEDLELNLISGKEDKFSLYDELGGFELRELRNRNIKFNKENRPNLYYPFYINTAIQDDNGLFDISLEPVDGYVELYPKESQGSTTVWRWGKNKVLDNININVKAKPMKAGGYQIVEKYRESRSMARSLWLDKEVNTEKGTLIVKDLFENKVFDYPKSVGMLERIIEMSVNFDDDDIVMDFFSGSATTAHAVMEQNVRNNSNLRFVMVQIPAEISPNEEAYKAGFRTIDQIGQERIIRAAKKLREENPDTTADLGFKHYTLQDFDDSFIDKLDEWYEKLNSPQEILLDEEDHMLNRFGLSTVLATYLVHDGYGFMPEVQELDLAGYTAYHCGNHLYLIREGFGEEQMKALYGALDTDNGFMAEHIVVFGYSFTFTASQMLRDNLFKVKDSAGINKTINIDVRY